MQSTAIRVVTANREIRIRAGRDLLVALGLKNLLAAVKTGGAYVMTTMHLARCRFDRRRRIRQRVVRAMHPTL
jgi:hypothetical protein